MGVAAIHFHPEQVPMYFLTSSSCHIFLAKTQLKGTGVTQTVAMLHLNTQSGYKPQILTPKRYDDHSLSLFIYMEAPLSSPRAKVAIKRSEFDYNMSDIFR